MRFNTLKVSEVLDHEQWDQYMLSYVLLLMCT